MLNANCAKILKVMLEGSRCYFYLLVSSADELPDSAIKTKIPKSKEVSCFKSLRCGIYHANKC